MKYDLSKKIDVVKFDARCEYLKEKKKKVDLIVKHGTQTISQNNYLHFLFAYYGTCVGLSKEEVKQDFKRVCPELFEYTKEGRVYERSSASLDKEETMIAIDNFITICENNGYPMPRSDDGEFMDYASNEIERHNQFLNKKY